MMKKALIKKSLSYKLIFNSLIFCSISVLLSSCSSSQQNLIIMPDAVLLSSISNQTNNLQHKSISLNVNDLRTNKHVVQIVKKDKPAQFINSETSLQVLIESTLNDEFKKKSAQINTIAPNQLTVNITNAVINVKQSLVKYDAKLTLEVTVSLFNGDKTLTKNYRRSSHNYGPLTADLAVLSRDFNQQLGKLLNSLVTDNELISLIK